MALHEMDPQNRFTGRAEAYRRYRPDYPASLLDRLMEAAPSKVADIGAGTGISSLQIAERGPIVFAIEPNAAMRDAGVRHPGIHWIGGTAEGTGLEDDLVDLVTCFQAFHWFEPEPTIAELTRILRPGGAIAAIWNERDSSDAFTSEYGALVRQISDDHPAESRENSVSALYESKRLGPVDRERFPHEQRLDLEGLVGRASSTSYLPSSGEAYEEMTRRLESLFDQWNAGGVVTLRYITSLYLTVPR